MKKITHIFITCIVTLLICSNLTAQDQTIIDLVIQDSDTVEYIYILTETETPPPHPLIDNPDTEEIESIPAEVVNDDFVPDGWSDDPLEVSEAIPYLWQSYRNGGWANLNIGKYFTKPSLWKEYGRATQIGEDGDGIEYIYYRTVNTTRPPVPASDYDRDDYFPPNWHDDPVEISRNIPYLWIAYRLLQEDGLWGEFSTPKPIAIAEIYPLN